MWQEINIKTYQGSQVHLLLWKFFSFVKDIRELDVVQLCLFIHPIMPCLHTVTSLILLSLPPSFVFVSSLQERNHTTAAGRDAAGSSLALTSSRVTSASTRATGRSSVTCANAPSPAPITWPCTWRGTCEDGPRSWQGLLCTETKKNWEL